MKKLKLFAVMTAFAVILSGCAGSVREPSDGGPARNVDVSTIPPLVAKPVTRTAAGNKSPYTVLGKTYAVMDTSNGYISEGTASWYGSKFHGRHTSNGEIFDMYGLTAAHKHLPIPTYAEVTNLDNGRKIIVRINDRGPFHGDRMIDLSWAAAAKLGFSDKGTAPVRVVALDPNTGSVARQPTAQKVVLPAPQEEAVPAPAILPKNSYYQIAAVSDRFGASRLAQDVEALTKYPVAIEWEDSAETPVYKVLVGPLQDRREINTLATILELGGLEAGFLVQLNRSDSAKDIENL